VCFLAANIWRREWVKVVAWPFAIGAIVAFFFGVRYPHGAEVAAHRRSCASLDILAQQRLKKRVMITESSNKRNPLRPG
jgi:hypothetical protein